MDDKEQRSARNEWAAIESEARAGTGPAGLSFVQQGLWLLTEFANEAPLLQHTEAVRLLGTLDLRALETALQELLARHDILRTTFSMLAGKPVQIAHPECPLHLNVRDLGNLSPGNREGIAREIVEREAARPFDLAQGPLTRFMLVRLTDQCHVFMWSIHHIISDNLSLGVFTRELEELYAAFREERPPRMAELPIQYADYAEWQRRSLDTKALKEHLTYWKQQLSGAPVLLDLPTDRPRPKAQSFRGNTESFIIEPQLRLKIEALSRESMTKPFMMLHTAFATLLARYSGQNDILLGSQSDNKTIPAIEPLIGNFARMLVLRTRFNGNPAFVDLLQQVRQAVLGAQLHQDLPFEKLVEELQPARNLSHNPLVQVSLTYQDAPHHLPRLEHMVTEHYQIPALAAYLDLEMQVWEEDDRLGGRVIYNTDLFDPATVVRFIKQFQTLLAGSVSDPIRRVGELEILSTAERHQLLVEWNDTKTGSQEDLCLHQLFEKQAERTPNAIAVEFMDTRLTYGELNARANQLAHHLRELGIGPEVLVGLCVERSLEMIVALLGILKAGAAYVPLDPAYPQDRLEFMLRDAQAPVVITKESMRQRLSFQGATLCLDSDWSAIARHGKQNPACITSPDSPVYAVYTSGSTGRPKGILLPHRSMVNLMLWHASAMRPGRSVLQFSSLSFDQSLYEVFAALISGGVLFTIPEMLRFDLISLAEFTSSQHINKVMIPVVVLQKWAELHPSSEWHFEQLEEIVSSGDQLVLTQPISAFIDCLPNCTLYNYYGPAETQGVTSYKFTRSSASWPANAPLGRPISNTEIYLLDDWYNPVPVGVVGELYIGGACLARGYLNRPDLTAQRFVPHPFSDVPGARLYRTGDLGRYQPDGTIEFLGRNDRQVKLRGYRIELGEVEDVLAKHPAVGELAVCVQELPPDGKRLICYVRPRSSGSAPTVEDLRRFLRDRLPDYMVPATFVLIDSLPLTPNGKIDYHVLSARETPSEQHRVSVAGPRTPTEAVLCEISADVLGLERVGVSENFFDLGGTSLLVTQFFYHLEKKSGKAVPPASLFNFPTVESLARHIDLEEHLAYWKQFPADRG